MGAADTTAQQMERQMKIYVACLAAYNNGQLHGAWLNLDLDTTSDDITAHIDGVIKSSPVAGAEEYAVHDYDGIPSSFGENPDFDAIIAYVAAVFEYGQDVVEAAADCFGIDYAISALEDGQYNGEFQSETTFAEHIVDECGMLKDAGELSRYFDFEAFGRDLFISDYTISNGHVFRN